MLIEWAQVFAQEDDRIFVKACGELAKKETFFPSISQILAQIEKVKSREDWEKLQMEFKRKDKERMANLTEEEIEMLTEIDSFFGGEHIDWVEVRDEARKELGRRNIDGK